MAVGAGDLPALVEYLEHRRRGGGSGAMVLLLQEAYAAGPPVPQLATGIALDASPEAPGARWTKRIAPDPAPEPRSERMGAPRTDIVSFASERGLSLCYVPSMRNGGPHDPAEDRGNAVVATVPLFGLRAVELPMERQRRVAVAARIAVGGLEVELCSVHLDNRPAWARAWRVLGRTQRHQMEGLLREFPPRGGESGKRTPAVLGGDFNTWLRGRRQAAHRRARARFPLPRRPDMRPTHLFEIGNWPRKSDYLMARTQPGWRFDCRRLDDTFGSDHYPLVGALRPPAADE